MKNLFRRITVIGVFACCIVCNYSFAAASKPAEYTMIIYLNGCDLENKIDPDKINKQTNPKGLQGEATGILSALRKSSFDDSKLNIIVITGGTNEWLQKEPIISTTQCQAWKIYGPDKSKFMERVKETAPSMYMMDKKTLDEYISWTIKEYPAKKYALFLWSHGAGPIGGFGADQLKPESAVKSISISDMQESLQSALKGKKFELIAFVACLMGNFETAYKLKDCGKYMVASEELEFGDCFEGIIDGLRSEPNISGKALGKLFIDAHFDKVKQYISAENLYTFSVIDLSKISDLKNKWDNMIQQVAGKMKDKNKANVGNVYRFLAIARGYSESYNEFARAGSGLTDMYEFADYISLFCNINTDELQKSIKNTVTYNKACASRPGSNGLSVFFVDRKLEQNLGQKDELKKYNSEAPSKLYFNFISDYYDKLFVQNPSKLIGEITFIKKPIIDQNPNAYPPLYAVDIDPGNNGDFLLVNQIFFVIGKLEGSGSDKVFKTLCIDKNVDNDFSKISVKVTGQQYCIGGKPVAIYWDGNVERWKNPKYIPLGSFPVKHKEAIKFLVVKETKPNVVTIVDVFNSEEFNGTVVPAGYDAGDPTNLPKIGENITILYKVKGEYVDGPEVKLDSYEIKKSSLEKGKYCGAYFIEDVIGRKTWSFYKIFNIESSTKIKSSSAADYNAPMPESQSL
ncbi:MAG: clostripain-related cysteine peptidase [Lentisphaerota bacterium]